MTRAERTGAMLKEYALGIPLKNIGSKFRVSTSAVSLLARRRGMLMRQEVAASAIGSAVDEHRRAAVAAEVLDLWESGWSTRRIVERYPFLSRAEITRMVEEAG